MKPVDEPKPEAPTAEREPMSNDSHGFGGWMFARLKSMLR